MRPNNSLVMTPESQLQDSHSMFEFQDDGFKLQHQQGCFCGSTSNTEESSATFSESAQDGDDSDEDGTSQDEDPIQETLSNIEAEKVIEPNDEQEELKISSLCESEQLSSSIEVEGKSKECEAQYRQEVSCSSEGISCVDDKSFPDSSEYILESDSVSPEKQAMEDGDASVPDKVTSEQRQLSHKVERELVPFDSNHRRSNSLVGSQALLPTVDREEEERRRQEVDHAMEALEHMRRANLVVEFGPNVDFGACVHCLRANHVCQNANPLQKILPKGALRQCLICQAPVCKHHWDPDFREKRVILCQECAPLFDLDVLVDCMRNDNNNSTGNAQMNQEQHMRKLLNLYDRALLALRYSSQNFDDIAQQKLMQTYWNKEGLGLGSTVTNIASGLTGLAATAVMLTPMGPSLLLTSLALGGIATAVGSGGFLLEQMCPQTQQAEQTIALASMVDSLLEATSVLREARLTATPSLPLLENCSAAPELEDGNGVKEQSEDLNSSEERPILFLEQDKEQQRMIATLKGALKPDKQQQVMLARVKERKARERRQRGPLGFLFQIMDGKKETRRERQHQRMDSDARFDELLEDVEEEENQGRLRKAARRVGVSLNNTKDRAGEAAAVAKTAAALAAAGMSAGGSFGTHLRRSSSDTRSAETPGRKSAGNKRSSQGGLEMFFHNLFAAAPRKNGDDSCNKEELESEEHARGSSLVARDGVRGKGAYANEGFMNTFVRAFFTSSGGESPTNDMDARERALVTKIRLKNTELMLKSSARGMKELTRTGFKVAKQQARSARASFINRHDVGPTSSDRIVVKHARFAMKATISVLREAARFAGGAFSAAIVCVETVELKNSVERIRAGNRCATAEQLQKLRQDVWSNQSSFPDTQAFEQELFSKTSPNSSSVVLKHEEANEYSIDKHRKNGTLVNAAEGSQKEQPRLRNTNVTSVQDYSNNAVFENALVR